MYLAYTLLLGAGFVLALPYYLWRARGGSRYRAGLRERLGRLPAMLDARGRRSVWVHAVSVGEVLTARPLLAALRRRLPHHALLVSTSTETGHAVAGRALDDVDGVFYAPFDWPGPVRRALAAARPDLLVLVETELWPNLIHESRRAGARVAVVNGRISPRSFPRYRRVRRLLGRVLGEVDLFLMQAEAHAERARRIGAPPERVRVLGNLKYDAVPLPTAASALARMLEGAGRREIWVAGSTVAGEEEAVLQAFRRVREGREGVRLVLAPRHPQRFDAVAGLVAAAGFAPARRSTVSGGTWTDGEVLLLDTMGELAQAYPAATVVFVGGSLVAAGGHNVLEAAAAGKAVIVGPHMENFQEIAEDFRADDALVQIGSAAELAPAVMGLLADGERRRRLGERARCLVERNRGGAERTAEALAGLLV